MGNGECDRFTTNSSPGPAALRATPVSAAGAGEEAQRIDVATAGGMATVAKGEEVAAVCTTRTAALYNTARMMHQ